MYPQRVQSVSLMSFETIPALAIIDLDLDSGNHDKPLYCS